MHDGVVHEWFSLYIWKWEGWRKEWERKNAMEAQKMQKKRIGSNLQRHRIGANLQSDSIKNKQLQFEVNMENNL